MGFNKLSQMQFSQLSRIKKFTPRKLNHNERIKSLESRADIKNAKFPRTSLLENSPTKEKEVIKMMANKHRAYPMQHPRNISNEDTNIISYKDKPLALLEEYSVPRELYEFQPLEFVPPPQSKSLDVGIIGSTNAGKSSLVNALTGGTISAVSPKSNTTLDIREGIWTDTESKSQIVLYDTPGAFRASKHSIFASNVITSAWSVLSDCDKVIFLVDAVKRVDRVMKLSINRFFKLNSDYKMRKLSEKLKSSNELTFDEVMDYNKEIDQEIEEHRTELRKKIHEESTELG